MRIDAYPKAVLTIIAIALVWISIGGPALVTTANAQVGAGQGVVIIGWMDRTGTRHYFPSPLVPEIARERGIGLPVMADGAR